MAESPEKRLKRLAKKSNKKLEKMTKLINKKSDKAIKNNLKDQKKQAKKADREVKRNLKKSNRAVKRATIESMPGNTMLEKRLNFAGAKARARKADRQETKRLEKEGPLQQTSRKIKMPSQEVKINQQPRKKIKVLETKERGGRSETGKSETRIAFEKAFAKARAEKGPNSSFTFRGKEYVTKLKGEKNKAKHGGALAIMIAPVKTKKMKAVKKGAHGAKMKKAEMGGKLKEVPSDNKGLGKLPKEVRNKMGYMKNGGKLTEPKKSKKFKIMRSQNSKTGEIEYFKLSGGESTDGGKTYAPSVKTKISKAEYDSMMGPKKKKNGKKLKSKLTPQMTKEDFDKSFDRGPFKPGKGDGYLMLPSNPPKYQNMKTKEIISEAEYYKKTGKKKPKGGIVPLKYGGAMKKAMYGAKMKKKAMYGAKMKKK